VKNNANAVRALSILCHYSIFGEIVYYVTLKRGSQSLLSPHLPKRILWTFIRFEQLHYDFQMAPILWNIIFKKITDSCKNVKPQMLNFDH